MGRPRSNFRSNIFIVGSTKPKVVVVGPADAPYVVINLKFFFARVALSLLSDACAWRFWIGLKGLEFRLFSLSEWIIVEGTRLELPFFAPFVSRKVDVADGRKLTGFELRLSRGLSVPLVASSSEAD